MKKNPIKLQNNTVVRDLKKISGPHFHGKAEPDDIA